MEETTHRGSCICGAVTFEVDGELKPPDACHPQCRKLSGHYLVAADIPRSRVRIQGEDSITWYQRRPEVRHGFCKVCGSTLFWDPVEHDWTAICLGAFDTPTRTELAIHIFVSEKGDYYELNDGLPQNER
jgi:hypothetical protein